MRTIFESCVPRDEVLTGELRDEMFAARLRDVIEGTADPIYQDPQVFFDNTFVTEGLRTLSREVVGRLSGKNPGASPFIRLETSFGGGKTHSLIALYHLAHGGSPTVPKDLVQKSWLPSAPWKVAAVVGDDIDPTNGVPHGNIRVHTLWGELAWQLGGERGYALLSQSDTKLVAPGTPVLKELVGDQPTLIMMDELARHYRAARAVATKEGHSSLAEQSVAFLKSLLEVASSCPNISLVITLAESVDTFGSETEEIRRELDEAKKISARQELIVTPTGENEISHVVNHRLFRSIEAAEAKEVASEYSAAYSGFEARGAELPAKALRAEYASEIEKCYPFHPEILAALSRRVATIPNFQRTRGVLRLLARVVRDLWESRSKDTWLIHPHHVNLLLPDVANDLTSRLEKPTFKPVIEADIVSGVKGMPAHCQSIDSSWIEAGKPPYAQRLATTIFLNSLTQSSGAGIEPADLHLSVLHPGDDPQHLQKALLEMKGDVRTQPGVALHYLHWDDRRYRFKTEPSLEKLVQNELISLGPTRIKNDLDDRIRQVWRKGVFHPFYFPQEAVDVPDDSKEPKLVILHYDAESTASGRQGIPDLVRKIYDHTGSLQTYRSFKNNLLFLVADADLVQRMQDVMARSIAIGKIVSDPERSSDLPADQVKRLREMDDAARLEVRIAITRAYRHLYYPSTEGGKKDSGLAHYELPAQDQGKADQEQSQVLLSALVNLEKVLTGDSHPMSPDYLKSKAWAPDQQEMTTEDLRKEFARRIGLKMLLDPGQLKKSIRQGVQQGTWVYYETAVKKAYGKGTEEPFIELSDEAILYTDQKAQELGIWPRTEIVDSSTRQCPICGHDPCDCPITPTPAGWFTTSHAGVPAQALKAMVDAFSEAKKDRIGALGISLHGSSKDAAMDLRRLGLAMPQIPRGDVSVMLRMTAETPTDCLEVTYRGPWDGYTRLRGTAETAAAEASKLDLKFDLMNLFRKGLPAAETLGTVRDILMHLELGRLSFTSEEMRDE